MREIPVNTGQFEPVEGIEVWSHASQSWKGVVSVSFHAAVDDGEKLWVATWQAGQERDVFINAAGREVRGVIQYQER